MASCSNDSHNAAVLESLKVGDLVEFPRMLYSHWGVYIGNQKIAHLTGIGDAGSKDAITFDSPFTICGMTFNKAVVAIDDFLKVAEGCKAKRNNDKDGKYKPLTPAEIVKRATEKVGEIGYNVIWNNCEHFAAYVRYGVAWSDQVLKKAEMMVDTVLWSTGCKKV